MQDHDYHWKLSLWDSNTARVSSDAFIDINATISHDSSENVHLFELTDARISASLKYYLYIDLIHRYTLDYLAAQRHQFDDRS